MAIKYKKPELTDEAPSRRTRTDGSDIRFRRFSSAPPSRKALSWIIVGTGLIVVLLMISSELPLLNPKNTVDEYVWLEAEVLTNENTGNQRILRVEISSEADDPPHVYDITLDARGEWAAIAMDDAIRIQVVLNDDGSIKQIIRIELVEQPETNDTHSENDSAED